MSQKPSAFANSEGSPNLDVLAYLQKNWTPADIAAAKSSMRKIARVLVAADASGGQAISTAIVPVGAIITNVSVICTGSNTAGTLLLNDAADTPVAITNAMVCAVDKVVVNAGTIDDAVQTVTAAGLKIVAGGTDATLTRGQMIIEYV